MPAAVGRNTIPTCEPCAGRRKSECHSDQRTLPMLAGVGIPFRVTNLTSSTTLPSQEPGEIRSFPNSLRLHSVVFPFVPVRWLECPRTRRIALQTENY